jgi:hypothetical protein
MKTKIVSMIAIAGALVLAGCGTPTQQLAQAGASVGNLYAEYELNQSTNPTATVAALNDLAVNLPLIPLGKVSTYQQGVIQGELQAAKATLTSTTPQKYVDAVASLIGLATTAPANSGLVDANMALAAQQASNVAYGITNYIKYWQGKNAGLGGASTTTPASGP